MAATAPPSAAAPPAAGAPQKSVIAAPPAVGGAVSAVNRPDEPPFQLKLEPEKLIFRGDKLNEGSTTVEVKLTNTTKDRHSFKVKCTSNEIFRVRPPLGYVDGEQTQSIKITFATKNGAVPDSTKHFFAFYHLKSAETKPARQVWTATTKPEGVKRILVAFEKEDGSPATTGAGAPAAPAAAAPADGAKDAKDTKDAKDAPPAPAKDAAPAA
ncbi:hypothetical protein L596_020144 [Steinernema carpocapsae]|uniref:Major sperm protein n=1 Tax=Steinernema carpocapsae TaxID=34508 RepID=A0A4U5MSV6_STECR|nr:hypothetical protein L596_020144 [Steinernema carpocapsae]